MTVNAEENFCPYVLYRHISKFVLIPGIKLKKN